VRRSALRGQRRRLQQTLRGRFHRQAEESNRGGRPRSLHEARRESHASLLDALEEIECDCILVLYR
jgi:hypothetical protein